MGGGIFSFWVVLRQIAATVPEPRIQSKLSALVIRVPQLHLKFEGDVGGCQNYGPLLGPYYNTGPNTGPNLGDPKRTIILTIPHVWFRIEAQVLGVQIPTQDCCSYLGTQHTVLSALTLAFSLVVTSR